MNTIDLIKKIESLPEESKKEIEKLLEKLTQSPQRKIKSMKELEGIFKGKIKMSSDFDEPLEDFKDYL